MALKLERIEKTTPEELLRLEQDEADFQWLADHAAEIEENYKGKYVAVVNQELFVGDSVREARQKAAAKYPNREPYIEFVPLQRRILVL